jgi:RNA polymerase sigma factor (sigma-70 family)
VATAAPEIPVLARDQAFESLYRSYVKDVYHYALALLRNPADAEDVTQTTFLNAYRAFQRGIEVEKPQNWLIKIAHNVARTKYARASRRVKEVPLEDHVEQLAVPEAEQPDVLGVLRALGRLPFNQRAALVMRELEGRSYAEISDTIGVSVSAVETLIFRARKSLRLKASALRVLSAVPLPGSLAQIFDGGGVVAGGGAALGTGFLVKAAVAFMAGVVATGIGGDHTAPTAAAAEPVQPLASGESWDALDGFMVRPQRSSAQGARHLRTGRAGTGSNATVSRRRHAFRLSRPDGVSRSPDTTSSSVSAAPSAAAPAASPVGSQVESQVESLASTVSGAVQAALPVSVALPVQAPSLPPLPVETPQIPGGTPLP